jgi:hypothetical protein
MSTFDVLQIDEAISQRERLLDQIVTLEGIALFVKDYRLCLVPRALAHRLNSVSCWVDFLQSVGLKMPGLARRLEGCGGVVMGGIGRINWLRVTGRLEPAESSPWILMLTDISACTVHHPPESRVEPGVIPIHLSTVGQLSPWERAEIESLSPGSEERQKLAQEFERRNQAW